MGVWGSVDGSIGVLEDGGYGFFLDKKGGLWSDYLQLEIVDWMDFNSLFFLHAKIWGRESGDPALVIRPTGHVLVPTCVPR